MGERQAPWGTPLLSGIDSPVCCPILILAYLLVKNEERIFVKLGCKLRSNIF